MITDSYFTRIREEVKKYLTAALPAFSQYGGTVPAMNAGKV